MKAWTELQKVCGRQALLSVGQKVTTRQQVPVWHAHRTAGIDWEAVTHPLCINKSKHTAPTNRWLPRGRLLIDYGRQPLASSVFVRTGVARSHLSGRGSGTGVQGEETNERNRFCEGLGGGGALGPEGRMMDLCRLEKGRGCWDRMWITEEEGLKCLRQITEMLPMGISICAMGSNQGRQISCRNGSETCQSKKPPLTPSLHHPPTPPSASSWDRRSSSQDLCPSV